MLNYHPYFSNLMMKVNDMILSNQSSEFYNHVTTYPSTHPTIFVLFIRVHLSWQTLIIFLFFSFTIEIYLSLSLLHQRAQIKLLSSFYLLYLSTYLPRLNSLVRLYSLSLSMKFKTWNNQY